MNTMEVNNADLIKIIESCGDAAKETGVLVLVFGVVERTWSGSPSTNFAVTVSLAVAPFVVGVIARDIVVERLRARLEAPYVD